jgi:hypothetical protein
MRTYGECPIPKLSNEDYTTIEVSVRESFRVDSLGGKDLEYSYSNKLRVRFQKLPRITSINPLFVPAETNFY